MCIRDSSGRVLSVGALGTELHTACRRPSSWGKTVNFMAAKGVREALAARLCSPAPRRRSSLFSCPQHEYEHDRTSTTVLESGPPLTCTRAAPRDVARAEVPEEVHARLFSLSARERMRTQPVIESPPAGRPWWARHRSLGASQDPVPRAGPPRPNARRRLFPRTTSRVTGEDLPLRASPRQPHP